MRFGSLILLYVLLSVACADQPGVVEPTTREPQLDVSVTRDAVPIALGYSHACALDAVGAAWCWGSNGYLQLGRESVPNVCTGTGLACSWVPVGVVGSRTFVQIGAGDWHSCGLTSAGLIYCWGTNFYGQLGNPEAGFQHAQPRLVQSGATRFDALAVGASHVCAIATDGAAWCWGNNFDAQIGDGTVAPRETPVAVVGGHHFTKLSAGRRATCGIVDDGAIWCWGDGTSGVLGNGTETDSRRPRRVVGTADYVDVSVHSEHACGVTSTNRINCWGSNAFGALGVEYAPSPSGPVRIQSPRRYTQVEAGWYHTCALRMDAKVDCWGWNGWGSIGRADTMPGPHLPGAVAGARSYVGLAAQGMSTCAVTADGTAYCWGYNAYAQAGRNVTYDSCFGAPCVSRPTRISGTTLFPPG